MDTTEISSYRRIWSVVSFGILASDSFQPQNSGFSIMETTKSI